MSISFLDRIAPTEAAIVEKYTSSFPVRVGELAKELGIEVVRAPMSPSISGLIKPSETSASGFEIRVNKYEPPERQRFTVAHEIAHYLLHRDDIGSGVVDSVMYRSSLTSKKEAEANRLAADITMPANAVARELTKFAGARDSEVAADLAALFKVSVPAMKVRLGLG